MKWHRSVQFWNNRFLNYNYWVKYLFISKYFQVNSFMCESSQSLLTFFKDKSQGTKLMIWVWLESKSCDLKPHLCNSGPTMMTIFLIINSVFFYLIQKFSLEQLLVLSILKRAFDGQISEKGPHFSLLYWTLNTHKLFYSRSCLICLMFATRNLLDWFFFFFCKWCCC